MAPKTKNTDKNGTGKEKKGGSCRVGDGCPVILKSGCVKGIPVCEDPLPEDCVHISCTNEQCPLGQQYIHAECYQIWEDRLVKLVANMSWARSWNDRQRRDNLWDRKGYLLVAKLCKCHCGLGQVRKDLDFQPPKLGDDALSEEICSKPKHKKKSNSKQLPSIRASDCKGIINKQLPNLSQIVPFKKVDNTVRCSFSDIPAKFPETELASIERERVSPDNNNNNNCTNYWSEDKEACALLPSPVTDMSDSSDRSRSTSLSSNHNSYNASYYSMPLIQQQKHSTTINEQVNKSAEWTLVTSSTRSNKEKSNTSRDSSTTRAKKKDNITNSEQLFGEISELLGIRSVISMEDKAMNDIKSRFSATFEQVVARAGGFAKLLHQPARNLYVSKSNETGIHILQLVSGKYAQKPGRDTNSRGGHSENTLVQGFGLIQNVFDGYGFIESPVTDTNVFFVPSHVKGRALKQPAKNVFPLINEMFKSGDKVWFAAKGQEAKSGCKWLATEVMFSAEKPKNVGISAVIYKNQTQKLKPLEYYTEDGNTAPLRVWTSLSNTHEEYSLKEQANNNNNNTLIFEDTPPLTPSPTDAIGTRGYHHPLVDQSRSQSPIKLARPIGGEKNSGTVSKEDGCCVLYDTETYSLFGDKNMWLGEGICSNALVYGGNKLVNPLDLLTTPWKRMW